MRARGAAAMRALLASASARGMIRLAGRLCCRICTIAGDTTPKTIDMTSRTTRNTNTDHLLSYIVTRASKEGRRSGTQASKMTTDCSTSFFFTRALYFVAAAAAPRRSSS